MNLLAGLSLYILPLQSLNLLPTKWNSFSSFAYYILTAKYEKSSILGFSKKHPCLVFTWA